MLSPTLGFIGGGRIVSILLGGWRRAGALPGRITVCDVNAAVLAALVEAYPEVEAVGADNAKAAAQDVVFLAVHPPAFKEVLPLLRPPLRPEALVVSLAPKFTTGRITEMLGGFSRVARIIPNAASLVGAGFNPMAFGTALPANERHLLEQLMRPLGACPEVAESKLEAYAILTAMGPTYFWYQLYELLALAESFGLSPDEAQVGLAQMISGTVATMNQSGLSPDQVKDLIPVKPLADLEPTVAEAYRGKLRSVMEKIKP